MVTVVLGRFDPLLERGLVDVLRQEGIRSVIPTDSEPEAVKQILALRSPEVVIMDEAAAREILPSLSSSKATTRAIVLARDPSSVYYTLVSACGAVCLPVSATPANLLDAVRGVSGGPEREKVRAKDRAPAGGDENVRLTRRELDVLAHLSRDRSYSEVAFVLKIGVETVRSHSTSIRRKLGVRTRRELVGMPVPLFDEVERGSN